MSAPPHPLTPQHLRRALKRHWGYDSFRPLQEPSIQAILARRDSLVVLPTGAGKSICYQLPAVVRDEITVVVSPLIALMKDQVDQLQSRDIPAAALNSSLDADERQECERDLFEGRLRLLFVSPERLALSWFQQQLRRLRIGAFAIDESHCISHWGHDFRPEYRQIGGLRDLFPDASFHAFTATATERVRRDITTQLRLREAVELVGDFDRPNLTYLVHARNSDPLPQIEEVLGRHKGEAGIIYCITRRDVDDLAAHLQRRGIRARPYHAGLGGDLRKEAQDAFVNEKCDVIVATIAFGMGIDRSNVRFVIHRGMPKSLEHFQQEAGRAGRDGLPAECVLLHAEDDVRRWQYFLDQARADALLKGAIKPEDEQAWNAQEQHLGQIQRFCHAGACRHRALVEHFGQRYRFGRCGACDVCLRQARRVADSVTLAQKILSCVARVGQRFATDHVVDVLLGRSTTPVQLASHDSLSTFGLLTGTDEFRVRDWISQLLDQELLRSDGSAEGVLQLGVPTNRLRDLPVTLLLEPARGNGLAGEEVDTGWKGVDRDLFEELRRVRQEVALEHRVAPDAVLSDLTLRELALRRPVREEQLRAVYGVGEVKARKFGRAFLEILRMARGQDPTEAKAPPASARRRKQEARNRQDREAEAALLLAVLAEPDNPAPRLLYADGLSERDRPRSEFIRLQCQLAQRPEGSPRLKPLEDRQDSLLRLHRRDWLGRLAGLVDACEFRGGFVESVTASIDQLVRHVEELFRLAPIREIHATGDPWQLSALLARPEMDRITALSLRGVTLNAPVVRAMALAGPELRLRSLDLGGASLDDEALAILETAWPPTLEILLLDGDPLVTDVGARTLIRAEGLKRLTRLDLRRGFCWSPEVQLALRQKFGCGVVW
jgi:ATP-dependent DNA helicase RecQ